MSRPIRLQTTMQHSNLWVLHWHILQPLDHTKHTQTKPKNSVFFFCESYFQWFFPFLFCLFLWEILSFVCTENNAIYFIAESSSSKIMCVFYWMFFVQIVFRTPNNNPVPRQIWIFSVNWICLMESEGWFWPLRMVRIVRFGLLIHYSLLFIYFGLRITRTQKQSVISKKMEYKNSSPVHKTIADKVF